jgi:hypothetical protein
MRKCFVCGHEGCHEYCGTCPECHPDGNYDSEKGDRI